MINIPRPVALGRLACAIAAVGASAPIAAGAAEPLTSPVSATYVVRVQAMEGIGLARSLMTAVATEYAASGKPPYTGTLQGGSGNYVSQIQVDNGRIDITYGNQADPLITGRTLSLTPYESKDGHVVWRCGNRAAPLGLKTLGTARAPSAATYKPSTVPADMSSAACAAVDGFIPPSVYPTETFDQTIAARVSHEARLAVPAERTVTENAVHKDWLDAATAVFNTSSGGSGLTNPYVNSVQIDSKSYAVTVAFNQSTLGASGKLVFEPFVYSGKVKQALASVLANGTSRPISWECAATSTLAPRYSRAACAGLYGPDDNLADTGVTVLDTIRRHVAEGLKLAKTAQQFVAESSGSLEKLVAATTVFNAQSGGVGLTNAYVTSVLLSTANDGEITVTFNQTTLGAAGTLVLTPNVSTLKGYLLLPEALSSGAKGPLEWACSSETNMVATSRGLIATTMGTLNAIYAPSDCR
jgi:type IV pilus assembly protein PilA